MTTEFRPGTANRSAADIARSFARGGMSRISSRSPIANIAGGVGGLVSNFILGGARQNRFDTHADEIADSRADWNRRAGNSLMESAGADALNRMQARGFDPAWFQDRGMPGITSPRGNDGGFQPIDLDYGQQVAEESPNGLPGITSANPYARPLMSTVAPNTVANISGGGARDAFAGTSGSSDWGNTFASLGMQGSSGGSHNSMAGPTAIADSLAGQSALRNRLREQLRQNPNDQSALALREQMRANRGAGR